MRIRLHALLWGHSGHVTAIVVSQDWSIIVSGCKDGLYVFPSFPPQTKPLIYFLRIRCIIWDLNRLCYVRSMIGHSSSITALAIAPSTGVIVTADGGPSKEERKGTPTSTLNLWSINGELLASTTCADRILCVAITSGNLSLYCFINSNDRNQKEWKACAGTPSLAGSSRGRSGYGMHGTYPSCAN